MIFTIFVLVFSLPSYYSFMVTSYQLLPVFRFYWNEPFSASTSISQNQVSKLGFSGFGLIQYRMYSLIFACPLSSKPFWGSDPHPIVLEKSFPVPVGIVPNGAISKSILFLSHSSTIWETVPSPPTAMILYYFSCDSISSFISFQPANCKGL